ncbi:MAG: hypothetical protein IJ890_04170 [Clostridia bacterium]|nr:hypothetical protein [Clostridia bacterium]
MKAKKIIIPIVIVLIVLALLGGIFAFLWFKTDLFNFMKPAGDVWENQIEKALNLDGAKFSDYSDFLKDYKEMSGKSYKSDINMTAKLNISELDSNIQNTINKSKIKLESSADISGKKTQNKVGLYSTNNSEILTLDLVSNDSKFGVGCKDLYDKYLSVSAEDLVEYLKKSNSKEFSSSDLELLEKALSGSNVDPYELLYVSDEDLKHFDDTYGNILSKLISKDCYSSEKNVEVSVDDSKTKTTGYYLTLTGADAYKFAEDLSKTVKDDSVISRIITDKINLVLENAGQKKISESDVKDYINQILDSLLSELESIKDEKDSAVQIAVYSEKNEPVRIDVNLIEDVEKKDDKETLFSIEYAKSKNIYTLYNNGKAYMTAVDEYTKNSKEERAGTVTIKVSGTSLGTIDYELINKDDESKILVKANVPLASVSATIDISTKGNYKKEPVEINGTISGKYGKESVEIKFDGKVEYGDVSIPELTSKNSVDVLKLSNKEIETELQKILKKASEILPNRLKSIGVTVKAEDIYKETKTEVTEEKNTDETKTDAKTETKKDDAA